MIDNSNFYDELDLKYPEIAIAAQDIDCNNPGNVKFIVPILTPNMDNSKIIEKSIYQNKQNLKNLNTPFEIDSILMTNYIKIPFPKELITGYNVNTEFDVLYEKTDSDIILKFIPKSSNNIIAKGSKWIIVFIGGDITKPKIIGRYTE